MDIERILKTRENAIYYGIGEYQKDCFGWVGGNAPACFDDKYLSDKDNLYFYLTFQNPLNPNKQISIFTPDFATRFPNPMTTYLHWVWKPEIQVGRRT